MTKEKKTCPHCGASMTEYKRGLTDGLAGCLKKLAEAGGVDVAVCNLDLNNSQYSAFAKLRLWELIVKSEPAEDRHKRGGYWSLTDDGWLFVKGKIAIPQYVIEYRGKVVDEIDKWITIEDVTEGWWYRPRVVEESRPHE